MIGRVVGLLSIPMMAFIMWSLIRQVRKPSAVRPGWTAIGLVMAPVMLIVNLVFLRQAAPGTLGVALLVFGIGFGAAWGFTARLSMRDEKVIADRSILHLVFWAMSFGLTQLLATFAAAEVVAGGLAAMFFATGATLGTSMNLLVRQHQIRKKAVLTADIST
ncbi:MAG: hypothetical protein M3096_06515 [Actinomycetia bacterium]|nr:hypothetical protein [Actinomycetes bacterium]